MTERERVICAIQHRETDIIPYYADFTGNALNRIIEYTGNSNFKTSFGSHIEWINATDFRERDRSDPNYELDEFGVRWLVRDEDIGIAIDCPLQRMELADYQFPVPDESRIRSHVLPLITNGRDTFKMVNVGFTLYERAWSLRGIEDLLADMILKDDVLIELMDKITAYNLAVMEIALSCGDFDAFYTGDDWGQQRGLIMGRAHWEKFIRPGIQKVFDYAKAHGKYTVHHACGDISELLPVLADMGLDVYETFQPEIYNIEAIKKSLGERITFLGGISTQTLLPYATPGEVRNTIKESMDTMRLHGGYIAAPTHAVPGDVPPENVMAMIEVFQNQ
jgi:uroporphyrinogen decarboxylase